MFMQETPREALDYNQCQEAVQRLTEYLSQELQEDEAEKVNQHLRRCRGCFARFHFEETLLRTIRERAEQVRAPGSLRDKILNLVGQRDEPATDPTAR